MSRSIIILFHDDFDLTKNEDIKIKLKVVIHKE